MMTDREKRIAGYAYSCGVSGYGLQKMIESVESTEADGSFDNKPMVEEKQS